MSQYIFKRIEKKYLLNQIQYEALIPVIEQHMKQDRYGLHTICNLYLDTDDYRIIRRSIEKPVYKEKLRLRSYGIPDENTSVFLELKKKYKGVVYKRRVEMTLKEAEAYLDGKWNPEKEGQVMKEIDYFMKLYGRPVPKVYISYDRTAYFWEEDKNLRITFDFGIRSRLNDLKLESGDWGEFLFKENKYLMEVKMVGALPRWLINALNQIQIYPSSFSKYGTVYTREILNNRD